MPVQSQTNTGVLPLPETSTTLQFTHTGRIRCFCAHTKHRDLGTGSVGEVSSLSAFVLPVKLQCLCVCTKSPRLTNTCSELPQFIHPGAAFGSSPPITPQASHCNIITYALKSPLETKLTTATNGRTLLPNYELLY